MDTNKCDDAVYKNGKNVAITGNKTAHQLERLCLECRRKTNQIVDWHWCAGRGVIKSLGDNPDKVRDFLRPNVSGWFRIILDDETWEERKP